MSDDPTTTPTEQVTVPPTTPGEHLIPKARFDEVLGKLHALEADAAKRVEADKKAADEKAKEEGRLIDVIAARDAEIGALKVQLTTLAVLTETLDAQITAEAATWPKEVQEMLVADDPIERRLSSLPRLRDLAAKLNGAGEPGTGNRPAPSSGTTPAESLERRKAEMRRTGAYGRF